MADLTPPHTAIIGCGNPNRSDDGAGPCVIRELRDRVLPEGVVLYDAGTDGMAVIYRARGVKRLILIDARQPENAPGAIYEVPGEVLEAPPNQSLNLHDFRWDHALYAGRKIYGGDFPTDVTVFLIEAKTLDLGFELSEPVRVAVATVTNRIESLLQCSGGGIPA